MRCHLKLIDAPSQLEAAFRLAVVESGFMQACSPYRRRECSVILLNGLPIYRSILFNPAEHKPQSFGSIIVIVVTMQVAHWLGLWIMPILRWRTTIVLAYVVLFLGRLSFVFGAAFFCVAFFVRLPEIDVTPFRVALLLAALFALFCYSSELERLGNALRGA